MRGPPQMLEPLPEVLPPRKRWPVVSSGLIVACVAMFLWERLARAGPVMPPLTLYGPAVRAGEYWRMLGFALEHGGALHLLFNMSAVYTLGFSLERELGPWRFAVVSVVTCLGSAAAALYFNFDQPTVGASGMILGWAGVMLPVSTRAGRQNLTSWLVQVALLSLLPGISWAGHLGGFLFGLPCGLALKQGPAFFRYAAPVLVFLSAVVCIWIAR